MSSETGAAPAAQAASRSLRNASKRPSAIARRAISDGRFGAFRAERLAAWAAGAAADSLDTPGKSG